MTEVEREWYGAWAAIWCAAAAVALFVRGLA